MFHIFRIEKIASQYKRGEKIQIKARGKQENLVESVITNVILPYFPRNTHQPKKVKKSVGLKVAMLAGGDYFFLPTLAF